MFQPDWRNCLLNYKLNVVKFAFTTRGKEEEHCFTPLHLLPSASPSIRNLTPTSQPLLLTPSRACPMYASHDQSNLIHYSIGDLWAAKERVQSVISVIHWFKHQRWAIRSSVTSTPVCSVRGKRKSLGGNEELIEKGKKGRMWTLARQGGGVCFPSTVQSEPMYTNKENNQTLKLMKDLPHCLLDWHCRA